MTLTEKKIQRMIDNYQFMQTCFIPYDDKTPAEQMTQLYYFLRDQMEDVERIDRQDAIDNRNRLNSNGYTGKAGH
tara:strand:+ start:504 stop:728 length:225 start_codon:yes stop_codon:yes gene_type:complete